jgi:hypothetical protein
MPKQNAEMTDAVTAHAAAKALLHHHHHVRINVRIHVMNAPMLHNTLQNKLHNTLQIKLHNMLQNMLQNKHIMLQIKQLHIILHNKRHHIFQFHNHQDAALDSIETATVNAFQMLFQILYLQVAHQVSQVMDSEIVSHQQAQSHALQDLH